MYYNCSLVNNNLSGETIYNEIPCIPKNNICTKNFMGYNEEGRSECGNHNASMEFECKDYFIFENGTHYNCISDNNKFNEETNLYSCVKSIKDKYSKPCIKEQITNYSECKQTY